MKDIHKQESIMLKLDSKRNKYIEMKWNQNKEKIVNPS